MKKKSGLGITAGVLLLFLMLTSVAQTATRVLGQNNFMQSTANRIYSDEIAAKKFYTVTQTYSGIPVLFNTPAQGKSQRREIAEVPFSGSDIHKFRSGLSIFAANATGKAGGGSFFSLFQIMESEEPIPTVALLVLVGLVAIIALKGRRK